MLAVTRSNRRSAEAIMGGAADAENVVPKPSKPSSKKEAGKKGTKRKFPCRVTQTFTEDADYVWKRAEEIVRLEKLARLDKMKRRAEKKKAEEEERDMEFEPLVVLGLEESYPKTSVDMQDFRRQIAKHYLEETSQGGACEWLNDNDVRRLDDPFQPEIVGASRRKLKFGKLKLMDLDSTKPFHNSSRYSVVASKRDTNGDDRYLIHWFAPTS